MPAHEEVITRFTAQDAFSATARRVQSATQGVASAAIKGGSAISGYLGRGAAVAAMGIVGLATASVLASSRMDSLKRGLMSVAGSTGEANRQLERLKAIARLPGLGFEEAVEMSVNLQSAGLSATQAEQAMMEFGNALAIVGRGKADLDGVARALTQISNASIVSQEEINQLRERVPQIQQIMKRAFGTSNTEELQKMGLNPKQFIAGIVAEMQRSLPRATGGIKAAFENLGDTGKQAFAQVGDAINARLVPVVDVLDSKLSQLVSGGVFTNLIDKIFTKFDPAKAEQFVTVLAGGLSRMGPVITTIVDSASKLVGFFTSLPPALQQAIGMLVVINKFTGGMVTGLMGSMASGGGGALGSALSKAILGPIGMIGSVLIIGAMDMAAKMSKAIEVLEMKAAMDAAVPAYVYDTDPVTGKKTKRPPTEAEIKQRKQQARKDFLSDKYGIDFDDAQTSVAGLMSNTSTSQIDETTNPTFKQLSQQTSYLREIADNTGDRLQDLVLGGGGRTAIDKVTLGDITSGRASKAEREMARAFNAFYLMGQEAAINQFIVLRRGG